MGLNLLGVHWKSLKKSCTIRNPDSMSNNRPMTIFMTLSRLVKTSWLAKTLAEYFGWNRPAPTAPDGMPESGSPTKADELRQNQSQGNAVKASGKNRNIRRGERRISVTGWPGMRRDEWRKQFRYMRNWSALGPYDSKEKAFVVEQRLIDRFQCEQVSIEDRNEPGIKRWYVCRFEFDSPDFPL